VYHSKQGSVRVYVLIFLVFMVVITLTAFIFNRFDPPTYGKSFADSFWLSLSTIFNYGVGESAPVTTGGRFVAISLLIGGVIAVGIFTALVTAYFVRNDLLDRLRVRYTRDHVVICGLGDRGFLLAKAFHERGHPVIVIEQNEACDLIEACEQQGSIVLSGDATEREVLATARLPEARYLIAVCGDDGTNAEIAAHARQVARQRMGRSLTCVTHIADHELWHLLRRWEVGSTDSFRLQFFNTFEAGAQALLTAYPPFDETAEGQGKPPHLLVVGSGKLAQSVVVHAARLWREQGLAQGQRLQATMVDNDTARAKESLYLRYPGLETTCEIESRSIDIRSAAFHHADFLFDAQQHLVVTAIYICLDEDALGLSAALALLHRIRRRNLPIVVCMRQDAGLATLLHKEGESARGFDNLHAFGLLEQTCHPDLVLGGANEVLARAYHAKYRKDNEKSGQDARSNPALVPWEQLSETAKESNRRQADHIGQKLQAIGCDLAPMTEWEAGSFTFAPEEVEHMAKMEHERWVNERRSEGWALGPRDPVKKTNPSLVSWEALPEEGKAFNREQIRELPDFLARAGMQIYRLDSSLVRPAA
jgi:hypothetical protein